jgi:hypothetical protein
MAGGDHPKQEDYRGERDQQGRKHGVGVKEYAMGGRYAGQWEKDQRHGEGRLEWDTGETYDGDFENDTMTGFGTYNAENGNKYTGEYMDGKKCGAGTMLYVMQGDKYEGQWKDGRKHGQGTYLFKDQSGYAGQWEDGKYQGRGQYFGGGKHPKIYADDYWFEGEVVDHIVYKATVSPAEEGQPAEELTFMAIIKKGMLGT